jgi:hypothetical protein
MKGEVEDDRSGSRIESDASGLFSNDTSRTGDGLSESSRRVRKCIGH